MHKKRQLSGLNSHPVSLIIALAIKLEDGGSDLEKISGRVGSSPGIFPLDLV
jgi:hypothetical protein